MDSLETPNISPLEREGYMQQHLLVKRFFSVRYGLAILIFLSNAILATQIFSLSIAIIAMVNHTVQLNQSNDSTKEYPSVTTDTGDPVYEWSPEIQGFLLTSSFYGSIITTIPSGYLAGVLGGKKIAGLSLFISSVLSLLIPLAADYGLPYLFLIRTLQGLAQGMSMGGLSAFWPKWAPPLERSQLSTIGLSGLTMGNFIVIFVGGLLCEYPGWRSIFYIFGGIGCVYCIIWFPLVYDDPKNHPFISESEKEYIISSMTGQVNSPSWSLPFKAMIKSLAIWAILVSCSCRFWLVSNLTSSLPMILDNMFNFNYQKNGFLSSLPIITSWIGVVLGGQVADFFLSKKILTLIRVRKLFTFLGMAFPSLFTVAIPYVNSITAIAFLTLASTISSLCFSGIMVNPLDIAPRYTSFILGLVNVFLIISGLVSPVVTGLFINQDTESGWKNVFFLSSAINLLGMIFYLIFGKADIQEWAKESRLTRF
ncbi:putative small intestine urate exporter isoform X2 [Macrotis lagotis]